MNAPLTANITAVDRARTLRLVLAWINGDKPALDLVLDEVMTDPVGTPGLLFSLIDFSVRLGTQADPENFVEQLQAGLARHMLDTANDDNGREAD